MNKLGLIRRIAFVLIALAFFTVVLSLLRLQFFISKPINLNNNNTVDYIVRSGSGISLVNQHLFDQGILSHPKFLAWYARLNKLSKIKAGEYRFSSGMTPLMLLTLLNEGKVIDYPVSLIEGWTFQQALSAIQNQTKLTAKTPELSLEQLHQAIGINEKNMEGLLFPDTYRYTAGMSDLDILKQAHLRMKSILATEWQNKADNLPYKSAYEALIMASIVEKETGVAYERAEIAGVFVRRLQKGMKLQTDPTVIYGLGDSYQGNIKRKHLKQSTPYNTYVIRGLPPTPIALAGREAIHAALHPAAGKSLYFVAKGDGSHQFSDTLQQHNAAVQQYQLRRRKNYRSSQ